MPYQVSQGTFARLVEAALNDLPEPFAGYVEEVPVEVRQRPTAGQLRSFGVRKGSLLLGLYHGRPRTQRSVEDSGHMPDVIYIFQESIEQVSGNESELIENIRTTVLHEIGHHFGMSEEDLDSLGYG